MSRTAPSEAAPRRGWLDAASDYLERPVVTMLFLGFSAGLPLVLVFNTLSAWLGSVGISRTAIGFMSWVALAYSFKVLWSPLVDHVRLPVLHRLLGQRRSWMLLAMVGVAGGLFGMAVTDPTEGLWTMALFAVIAAFSSATQDISIDAYRIESAPVALQGAMSGAYQAGYMFAVKIVGGAGALYLADIVDWRPTYTVMAALMGVGMVTVLVAREPDRGESRTGEGLVGDGPALSRALVWFGRALVDPFLDFFRRNGWIAVVILAFIGVFRLSDITLGVMANPFYLDMQYSLSEIATATKVVGIFMTVLGAVAGGVLVSRFGVMPMLLAAAIALFATNLLFAGVAWLGQSGVLVGLTAPMVPGEAWLGDRRFWVLATAVSADNLAFGLSGSAFIAYLSSLTSVSYTATQYALFSSLMTLPGKFLAGFSGVVVDTGGYVVFFVYASGLGLPAIALVLFLMRHPALRAAESRADESMPG